jgi:hypothetical protein
MRIIRLKLQKAVNQLLEVKAKQFRILDPGFMEDLFAFFRLKGSGLPSPARVKLIADQLAAKLKLPAMHFSLLINKRTMQFKSFAGLPYFKALCFTPALIEGIGQFLVSMNKLYLKNRQSQCLSCSFLASCVFGSSYGKTCSNITKVIDQDFLKKVHPQCPYLPEINGLNQTMSAVSLMSELLKSPMGKSPLFKQGGNRENKTIEADLEKLQQTKDSVPEDAPIEDEELGYLEDEDFNCPRSNEMVGPGTGTKSTSFSWAHICKVSEKFIDSLSTEQLAVFELGRVLDLELGKKGATSFAPVPFVEEDKDREHVESVRDLTKVVTSELANTDEIFELKMQKRSLVKEEFQEPSSRRQLLHVLIDSSGSMCSQIGSSLGGAFTRGSLATMFASALARKLKRENGIMFIRFFGMSAWELHSALNPKSFDPLIQYIEANDYSAGGTCIGTALVAAAKDIKSAGESEILHKAEVLVITDGDDQVGTTELHKLYDKIELSLLDVSGAGVNAKLKALVDRYYKVDNKALDIKKMVSLI